MLYLARFEKGRGVFKSIHVHVIKYFLMCFETLKKFPLDPLLTDSDGCCADG